MIKLVLGVSMIVFGVVLGLYLGFYVFFVGGIIGLIDAIRAEGISGLSVAVNVGKIMLAGFVGILSGGIFVIMGRGIIKQRGR